MTSVREVERGVPQMASGAEDKAEQGNPHRWAAVGVLLLASALDLIDSTIVNVAIPSIQRDLGTTYAAIQWVVAGYALAFALLLITGGRLGDIFGRKRMFLIGVIGFTLASAACGAAINPAMLVSARIVQGAAAALMVPQVLAIIQVIFPPKERPAVFGVYGSVLGLTAVAGPILGGVIVQANLFGLEWRPIFYLNLVVGVVAVIAATVIIPESKAPQALRLDLVGVLLLTLALGMLLFPLIEGRELDWPAWGFALMIASAPTLALFALYERYKTRRDGSPLVVLALFRQRAFVLGLLENILLFAAFISLSFVLTLYLQIGLGFSPLSAGLTLLPFSLGSIVGSGIAIPLPQRLGRNIVSSGALILMLAMLGLLLTIHVYGTAPTIWTFVPAMSVAGLGFGMVVVRLVDIILAGVHPRDAGSASGVFNATNQLGGAIGVAVIGVIFFSLLTSQATASANAVTPQLRSGLQAAGVPAQAQTQIIQGFKVCYHDRAAEKDPTVIPASCRQSQSGGALPASVSQHIAQTITTAGHDANARNFALAIERILWYVAGAFLLCLLLIFLLPAGVKPDAQKA
ncbi:MAG TPA: MFS transporter [Ktedonobacterales bacterium]|nr:MFS transporter [Ktedonobacterales bacterium]